MGATSIRYNGIDIVNVLIDSINQETIKEPTGVDPLYVQTQVTVTGVLHFSSVQPTTIGRDVGHDGGNLAEGYSAIIAPLMQPRRQFLMTLDGKTLFNIVPGHVRPGIPNPNQGNKFPINQIDVNHGPVTRVRILKVVAAKTMTVQFTITFCTPLCDVNGQSPGGVISFRFWIAEDIDCTDWTTQRIYHGRLRVAHLGHNVLLELRKNFKSPALQRRFMRRRIALNQSSDGLELEFTVTDKRVWAVAPSPATEWRGHHTITSPKPGGAVMNSEVYLYLKGPNNVPKRNLIQLAQRIMQAKLHIDDLKKLDQSWLQYVQYKDIFHENAVEAHAVVRFMGADAENKLWNVADLNNNFGLTLDQGAVRLDGYKHNKAFHANPTATLKGLFLAYLNDPCHVNGFPGDNPNQSQKGYDDSNDVEVIDQGDNLDKAETQYSDEHRKQGVYNVYRMSSDVKTDHGKIHLPVGVRKKSTDPATALITLHQGISERVIRIEAERLKSWPTLPEPKDFTSSSGNIAHHLLRDKIYPSAPQLSADGKKTLYHLQYELCFGLSKIPDYSKGEIPAALLPYRLAGQDNVFLVPASTFKPAKGILTESDQTG